MTEAPLESVVRVHVLRRGSSAWAYMAAGIILWDCLAAEDEQMTRAFRRGVKTRKIIVTVAWAYLTGHLYGIIPDQFDVIHLAGVAYRGRLGGQQAASPAAGA